MPWGCKNPGATESPPLGEGFPLLRSPPDGMFASVRDAAIATDSGPFEPRYVRVAEGRIRVYVTGQGPPILFLHGVSAQARSWFEVARRLASNGVARTCWMPDLLGRGGSDGGAELRFSLDDEVRRLEELVGALSENESIRAPALVVGHSHGAAIALAYAGRNSTVTRLMLANPVTAHLSRPPALNALDSRLVRHALASGFAPLHRVIGRLVLRRAGGPYYLVPREISDAYAAPFRDVARARGLMRILADWRPEELATRMPTRRICAQVVAGCHDPRVPLEAAERLADDLKATVTRVEDGGHVLPEQHPALIASLIADLLKKGSSPELAR